MAGAGSAPTETSGGNGTTAGGAPGTGGTPDFGGMAGGGAAPTITLPPGCQPRTPLEADEFCSLGVDCDTSPSVRTYCHRLDSGQWECQCANEERLYRLEKAAGLQACALAARLCADKQLELGEERCEPTSDSSAPDSCALEVACSSPVKGDATADGEAWVLRSGSARCEGSAEDKSFRCSCVNGVLASVHQVRAGSGELACGPLVKFCMTGATPTFDGEDVCVPSFSRADSTGCLRIDSCGPQMPLTSDVSLVELEERTAECTPVSGGGSDCYCYDREVEFSFRQSPSPVATTCESSMRNCDRSAVIESTGAATCEPLAIDLNDASMCTARTTCLQPVTIDERSLLAKSNLDLICRREGTGEPWWCSCASGPESSRLELGAIGVNASEACRQGAAACLQQKGLHLGPHRDLAVPEDPVP